MKLDISRVATLANLPLSKEEIEKLAPQLEETLAYIDQLNEVDTKNVKPTSQVTGLENVMAEDVITPSLTQAEATANSSKEHNGYFQVPGILENS